MVSKPVRPVQPVQRGALPGGHGIAAGLGGCAAHERLHVGQQHVARQGGLAGAADAGDGDQALERHGGGDVLQVVQTGAVQASQCKWRHLF
jgi:hypothetical protein